MIVECTCTHTYTRSNTHSYMYLHTQNSHNSRFTARMSELLTVLSDMEKGVYERTMVSSQPSESTEDGTGRKREREGERDGEREKV